MAKGQKNDFSKYLLIGETLPYDITGNRVVLPSRKNEISNMTYFLVYESYLIEKRERVRQDGLSYPFLVLSMGADFSKGTELTDDFLQTKRYRNSRTVKRDKQKRIGLLEAEKSHANLTEAVIFIGAYDHLEMWDPETLRKYDEATDKHKKYRKK
ncbi:MAG: division/cell wall cluster transcriptional repressor MraZ [Candidatus Aenigmatarchaeota archaeon]